MLETPFIGTPPSQLLHAIARACKRVYRDEWRHSIAHTRAKAFQLAKERLMELVGDIHATPRPDLPGDADATVGYFDRELGAKATDAIACSQNADGCVETTRWISCLSSVI